MSKAFPKPVQLKTWMPVVHQRENGEIYCDMCEKQIAAGAMYMETIPGSPKAMCYACTCEAYEVLDQFVQEVDDGT